MRTHRRAAGGIALAIGLLTLVVALCGGRAFAEARDWLGRSDFDRLKSFAAEKGFDAEAVLRALVGGGTEDAASFLERLLSALAAQLHGLLGELMPELLAPVAVCAAVRAALAGRSRAGGMTALLCTLCCAVTLGERTLASRETATAFLDLMNDTGAVTMPVLVSAAALSGAPTTASILTPLAAECAALIDGALRGYGLGLCMAGAAVAVAGSLSRTLSLSRLFALIRSALRWLMGAAMFAFGALLSARGLMGAASDSAAARATKSALETLIPIIGGEVSGAAGALVVSVRVLRQALGLTGAAFVLFACVGPLTRLGAAAMAMKLCAAILEPVAGDLPAVGLIGRFAEIQEWLMALCGCAAVVTVLMTGGCAVMLSNIH